MCRSRIVPQLTLNLTYAHHIYYTFCKYKTCPNYPEERERERESMQMHALMITIYMLGHVSFRLFAVVAVEQK
jgi:hypothetical protein